MSSALTGDQTKSVSVRIYLFQMNSLNIDYRSKENTMKWKNREQDIVFQFQKTDITEDVKSIFSLSSAEIQWERGLAKIKHKEIADLNIHQIKKLGLPPVCPYRLKVSSMGRPITPAFSVEWEFLDEKSHRFFQVQRTGVILKLDGKLWTLTNPHF